MINIRRIEEADLPGLVEMGRRMHAESAYREFEFDTAKVRFMLRQIISNGDLLGLAAEREGELIGAFLGGMHPMTWCNGSAAGDLILYVDRPWRGSSAASRLVKEYVKWAKDRGADMITIANSTEIDAERVGRFYERAGFERIGYVCKYKED